MSILNLKLNSEWPEELELQNEPEANISHKCMNVFFFKFFLIFPRRKFGYSGGLYFITFVVYAHLIISWIWRMFFR